MIEAVVSEHVNAPADRVRDLYRDPGNWACLFPATIRGARVIRKEGDTTVVEVDHVEGNVVNILRDISSTRTDLLEFKRRYDATFVNEFIAEHEGMRYTLTASVRLKWPYWFAAPFVKPLVLARMRRYVVEPLKAAAERDHVWGSAMVRFHESEAAHLASASMMPSHAGVIQALYTERLSAYEAFISFFRSRAAIRALLERSGLLHPRLRVLDAGAGFGTATFALLDALRAQDIDAQAIDAFDLTPAMLDRFQGELDSRGITLVRHKQANVLELEQQLPPTWRDYDLIMSASMLEYVPTESLPHAISALGARLAPNGRLLVVITRKNWITKVLIEWWWHAGGYSRKELRAAFATARFSELAFLEFPLRYFWQNVSNHVVLAKFGR